MSEPRPTQAAKTKPPTTLPYWRGDEAALCFESELESEPESESESPPRPSNTWPAVGVEDAPVAEGVLAEDDVLFTRVGFRAPHGWFCRQSLAQAESLPQPVTHWLPHSWQMKKGRVSEYSERFGDRPLSQTQP